MCVFFFFFKDVCMQQARFYELHLLILEYPKRHVRFMGMSKPNSACVKIYRARHFVKITL